ncbi:MAG: hypothetical protein HY878_01290, partial [Deltaproteobacteria bacterium]|nr:hypothetical protein [Deltaproteobacteria bacterium]
QEVLSLIGIFLAIFLVLLVAGIWMRKLPARVVKTLNTASFFVAIASGMLLYLNGASIFKYIFFASLVAYFLFYNYKEA